MRARRGSFKCPITDLKVDESFFIPNKTVKDLCDILSMQKSKNVNRNKTFSTSNIEENGIKGVKVSRVE